MGLKDVIGMDSYRELLDSFEVTLGDLDLEALYDTACPENVDAFEDFLQQVS